MEVRTFVEIDIPISSGSTQTFRFTYAQEDIDYDAIPALESVSISPAVIDPGVSIGVRASVRVSIRDFQYPLDGTAFDSGTFFGKLRARRRSLQGLALRVIRGEAGQSLSDMRTEHYVIESLARSGEKVSITAKDLLKLADGDRAQAPAVSTGRLLSAISASDGSLTLTPTGIGDVEYPSSGKVAIGGSEICSFTRSGDTMTITRAQSGTEAKQHDADETVQLVLEYTSESPADIVYDLLTNYTDIDASWCPLSEWKDDIDSYIGRLYTTEIAEPTPVKDLLNELIEQVGLVMWWGAEAQKVRLKSLRPVTSARDIDTDEIMADSFRFVEQPTKRVSEVWTYFALRNPLEKLDDTQNYRSVHVTIDPDALDEYEQPAIRKIYSRWIGLNNRPAAARLNDLLIARYRDPPRKFSFTLFRTSDAPELGQGLNLDHWSLQDEDGAGLAAPAQLISVEPAEDRYVCDAEEMLFTAPDDSETGRLIIIDTSVNNVNLRTLHDALYTTPESGDQITCVIPSAVVVGSNSATLPAFDVGTWPEGVTLSLVNNGRITGRGGSGGTAYEGVFIAAGAGGPGFYTRQAITITNNGVIAGGGGGGGGGGVTNLGNELEPIWRWAGGGGGAGHLPGAPGDGTAFGQAGTLTSGGSGGFDSLVGSRGGSGGGPGQAGTSGNSGAPGGAAGSAIDGDSFVTFSVQGTILGSRVN